MTTTVDARPTEDDETAIREVVAEAVRTQTDTDALMALHHPVAVVVNVAGRRVLGRDALRAAMDAALASPIRDVLTEVEVEEVRMLTPDVALASCLKRIVDRRPEAERGPLPATAGAMSYVMVRTGGRWAVALAQTTPILG